MMQLEMMDTLGDTIYISPEQIDVIAKEYGVSPKGNPFQGAWVYRNMQTGAYIDHDFNRNDLFERHNISILEF